MIAAILGGYSGRNSFSFNFKQDYNSFAQQVQYLTDGRIDVERIRAIMHPFAGVLASVAGFSTTGCVVGDGFAGAGIYTC